MKDIVLDAMTRTGLVPVFYSGDIATACNVLKACYNGGVRVFEFTNRGEKAAEVFAALAEYVSAEFPDLILGVGSISFARDARRFIKMGARFVVGPQYVPSVVPVCRLHGVPYVPGCGSVSEVGRAQRHGCKMCKVFPGDVLGPKFVKAILAPMPWSRLMVTGGVRPEKDNLEAWFSSGACCVGMGSNLFPKEAIEAADWSRISSLCSDSVNMIREIRGC